MENIYNIILLFRKSFSGNISENESSELDKLLANDSLREVYSRLNDKEFIDAKFRELNSYPYQAAYEKLIKKDRSRSFFRRMAVAVSIAVVIAAAYTAGNLFLSRSEEQPTMIEPGRNLATITLTNGQTMILGEDTVLPEDLSGGARITEVGELAYDAVYTNPGIPLTGFNQIYIPVGGEYKLRLDDHTVVWLNSDSRLRYPVSFPDAERRVTLTGEAYFEVAADERQFIVETCRGEVKVLGTWFGISSYPGETEYTTLVKGSVMVSSNTDETLLVPGEQAVLSAEGVLSVRMVNVDEFVGWKNGEFIFRDKTLSEIMRILDRWYGVSTEFNDPSLAEIRYTGNLMRYDSINAFLALLLRLNGIRHRIDENAILLYK